MTLQELYENALQRIGIIAAGEAASPEDLALVADKYEALYELLNAEELVRWSKTGNPPDAVDIPLTAMLAAHAAMEFSVPPEKYAQLLQEGGFNLPQKSWAERQLRRLMARKYVPSRMRSEYY